ncbi:hypothetical protein ACFYV7_30725 [Nocardia suismassiliense]|uniref:Uncharacterized protein n=1 Tax=Nocardia suismassiliense TaxID=2077092 RepID=A0ABW6R124_9NOCA
MAVKNIHRGPARYPNILVVVTSQAGVFIEWIHKGIRQDHRFARDGRVFALQPGALHDGLPSLGHLLLPHHIACATQDDELMSRGRCVLALAQQDAVVSRPSGSQWNYCVSAADRLVMSIRTVEGHLFRASQRTGINTREGLAAILDSAIG